MRSIVVATLMPPSIHARCNEGRASGATDTSRLGYDGPKCVFGNVRHCQSCIATLRGVGMHGNPRWIGRPSFRKAFAAVLRRISTRNACKSTRFPTCAFTRCGHILRLQNLTYYGMKQRKFVTNPENARLTKRLQIRLLRGCPRYVKAILAKGSAHKGQRMVAARKMRGLHPRDGIPLSFPRCGQSLSTGFSMERMPFSTSAYG